MSPVSNKLCKSGSSFGWLFLHLVSPAAKLPKRRQILNEGTYDRAKKTAMPTKVSQNYAIYEILCWLGKRG